MGSFPHTVEGDAPVTAVDVLCYSTIMVLMAGLGGVPFFFVRGGLSTFSSGASTALAAGVMLSASYTMIYEGQGLGPKATVVGLALGADFIRRSKAFLEKYEGVKLYGLPADARTPAGLLLFVAVMALHSFGEGAGVGVAFARGEEASSAARNPGTIQDTVQRECSGTIF